MTNDVKKTNLVGNCEHTREGLELARWEKKTHPGHCPVDNDKDRSPFLSSRPTGHKEVDLLVSLARSERMGKWGAGVRKNDIKGISWEFFISPAFGRVKMIRHTRALPKWFSLRGNIGRRGVGPAQDCRTRISDFRWSFECHRVRSNIILLAICLLMQKHQITQVQIISPAWLAISLQSRNNFGCFEKLNKRPGKVQDCHGKTKNRGEIEFQETLEQWSGDGWVSDIKKYEWKWE